MTKQIPRLARAFRAEFGISQPLIDPFKASVRVRQSHLLPRLACESRPRIQCLVAQAKAEEEERKRKEAQKSNPYVSKCSIAHFEVRTIAYFLSLRFVQGFFGASAAAPAYRADLLTEEQKRAKKEQEGSFQFNFNSLRSTVHLCVESIRVLSCSFRWPCRQGG